MDLKGHEVCSIHRHLHRHLEVLVVWEILCLLSYLEGPFVLVHLFHPFIPLALVLLEDQELLAGLIDLCRRLLPCWSRGLKDWKEAVDLEAEDMVETMFHMEETHGLIDHDSCLDDLNWRHSWTLTN